MYKSRVRKTLKNNIPSSFSEAPPSLIVPIQSKRINSKAMEGSRDVRGRYIYCVILLYRMDHTWFPQDLRREPFPKLIPRCSAIKSVAAL